MQNDEQAIRQLVATWLSASKAGDTEKVLSLMAEDVVFLVPGQPPMRGKSTFAAGQSGLRQFDIESTSEIQEVKVFGEWAYLWTTLSVVATPRAGGAPSSGPAIRCPSCKNRLAPGLSFVTPNMLAVVPE